jgi:hypothetical protein
VELFRLIVQRRGKAYAAQGSTPDVTAIGASVVDAAENARLMAMALFDVDERPPMLLIRTDRAGMSTVVMQPFNKRVAADSTGSVIGVDQSSAGVQTKSPE